MLALSLIIASEFFRGLCFLVDGISLSTGKALAQFTYAKLSMNWHRLVMSGEEYA
jgi:hypothetical protein